MSTLLPNAEQTFLDQSGVPLAGGSVQFFIPNTSTPKATYQDAGNTILNTNPVILDTGGRAIIYGTGQYRQVLKDSLGNTIWDQLTQDISTVVSLWCGSATGTGNAIILSPSPAVTGLVVGQTYAGLITNNNSGPTTLQISALSAQPVNVNSSSGLSALSGGELVVGNVGLFLWDGAVFILQNPVLITILPGTMIIWPKNTPPTGYLECNGASVLRATYPALFSICGTTFGSVDGTHFTLPDMRGYFPRGWDNGAGVDPARTFGSTQAGAFASHTHTANVTDPGHVHHSSVGFSEKGGSGNGDAYSDSQGGSTPVGSGDPGGGTQSSVTGITVANVNTGGTETRPINLALMFCIKF